jgi:Short C-terminal domain
MPMIRRRRPVLRAAGAAAVGGAAYRAGKRSTEASQSPAPGPDPTYYPPPQPPSGEGRLSSDTIDQLSELGRLHEQGVLTDEEFEEQKRRYLQAG